MPLVSNSVRLFSEATGVGADGGESLVAVRVVAVIVRVEHEADRLVGRFADELDHLVGLVGKAGVDHQHEILEDHPALVAANEFRLGHCLAEEDTRRDFGDDGLGRLEPTDRDAGGNEQESERRSGDEQAFTLAHGGPFLGESCTPLDRPRRRVSNGCRTSTVQTYVARRRG